MSVAREVELLASSERWPNSIAFAMPAVNPLVLPVLSVPFPSLSAFKTCLVKEAPIEPERPSSKAPQISNAGIVAVHVMAVINLNTITAKRCAQDPILECVTI